MDTMWRWKSDASISADHGLPDRL